MTEGLDKPAATRRRFLSQSSESLSVRDPADITSKTFQIHVVVKETGRSEVRGQGWGRQRGGGVQVGGVESKRDRQEEETVDHQGGGPLSTETQLQHEKGEERREEGAGEREKRRSGRGRRGLEDDSFTPSGLPAEQTEKTQVTSYTSESVPPPLLLYILYIITIEKYPK